MSFGLDGLEKSLQEEQKKRLKKSNAIFLSIDNNASKKDQFSAYSVVSLYDLLKNFGTKEHRKYFFNKFKNKDIKFSELKDALAKDIANYFAPFREKRRELEKDPEEVKKILDEGAKKARVIAQETMKEVKEKIGLIL